MRLPDEEFRNFSVAVVTGSPEDRAAAAWTALPVSEALKESVEEVDFPWLYKYRPLWDIVVLTPRH